MASRHWNRTARFLRQKNEPRILVRDAGLDYRILICFLLLARGYPSLGTAKERSPIVAVSQPQTQDFVKLQAQAEAGDSAAQDTLGTKYLVGDGVEENKEEAVNWFRKSARQRNSSAMYHLGAAYYNGDGVPVSDSLSYAWFRVAKEAGNPNAAEAVQRAESELKPETITIGLDKIAEMYEADGSLPENETEAARWWSVAAARGDEDARVALAVKMVSGQGVPQDLTKGRHWCDQAAKNRNHRAEYCMGHIYEQGLGVKRDPKKAREWYEPAAAAGLIQAMRALALMEIAGEGGKVDRISAFLLYARLAESKDEGALRSLAKLRKEITPKEWTTLQPFLIHIRIDPAKLDRVLQRIDSN